SAPANPASGLDFIGSMDWLPNTDGVLYFVREILPIIRRTLPQARLSVVGRTPSPEITALKSDPHIEVTGTVPDIRPYVWNAGVSIVPLRIGGGTRLKIYESMAARTPVVSTTVGAEGLAVHPPADIRIADGPEAFARECIVLLQNPTERDAVAEAAFQMVSREFSWDSVTRSFEEVLESGPTLC
ncbi:MAG: glycosyltransferase family 4 protein, partial [Bryobacteraceae bacterium]